METEIKISVKIKRRKIVNGFMLIQQTISKRNSFSKKNFYKKNLEIWDLISISKHWKKS